MFEARGQLGAALAKCRQALRVRTELAKTDPTNAQAQRDVSPSHERVGGVLRQQASWHEALVAYKALRDIAQRLADGEQSNRQWQLELAIAHHNVAIVLDAADQPAAALEAYEAALDLAEPLARAAPSEVQGQDEVLTLYWDLGQLQESNI